MVFSQLTEALAENEMLRRALSMAGVCVKARDKEIARLRDATPQALDHWEEMEAQTGARGHYIREDAEWMLNNGQVQELTEIVKELNAEIAKRQPRVTEAAE